MPDQNKLPGQDEVNALIGLYRRRQYGDAIEGGKAFVEKWPDFGFGWNLLAASFEATGRTREAVGAYSRAIALEPENPEALNNYGNVLRDSGDPAQSLRVLEKAKGLKPDSAIAHYNLGLTQMALDKYRQAEQSFKTAIHLDPRFADAYNGLGNACKYQSRFDAAIECYQKAADIVPDYAEVLSNLGDAQLGAGLIDEAEISLKKAHHIKPDSPDILGNLGALKTYQKDMAEAEKYYRKSLMIDPHIAASRNNLGIVLKKQGRLREAEAEFNKVLTDKPDSISALQNLGNLMLDSNKLDEGLALHRRIVDNHPEYAPGHRNLGVTCAVLGDVESALRAYRKAIDIDPDNAETYYRISEIKRFRREDEELGRIENLIGKGGLSEKESAWLHYAAGNAYSGFDDETDKSFAHYAKGAAAKRATLNYDVSDDENQFARIARFFNKERMAEISGRGVKTQSPLFVVGMPRSGTTLVEAILASHGDVFGAGERSALGTMVKHRNRASKDAFPRWLENFGERDYIELGGEYVAGLEELPLEDAGRVVDKMPDNFRFSGLIAAIFSGAKVIHVRRNPMDTCLSCFTHLFTAENAWDYSYDLTELGRYYRAYWQLADHWRDVLEREVYYEVWYEDLVNHPRQTVGGMLRHCQLAWDPACLDFYKTRRAIQTASLLQVRQPLYTSSMERWRRYETQLQPLSDLIGDLRREITH